MPRYNQQPKPRALFINFGEEEQAMLNLNGLFPTIKFIEDYALHTVHQREFEVIVAYDLDINTTNQLDPAVHTLAIAGSAFPSRKEQSQQHLRRTIDISKWNRSVATEFTIPDQLDSKLQDLVRETALQDVIGNSSNDIFTTSIHGSGIVVNNVLQPILQDGDGNVLAGYYLLNDETNVEFWFLPSLNGISRWLDLLVHRWAVETPNDFPFANAWKGAAEWQAPVELALHDQLNTERTSFAALTIAHEQKISHIATQLEIETEAANDNYRVILTDQGENLKDAVEKALNDLGFTVTDGDSVHPAGDRLEDIQISTTIDGNVWRCLIEVRGYKHGAQMNDLLRISRFVSRYQQDNAGIPPNAAWYIANHDLATDPGQRQLALTSNSTEVGTFAETFNGLVIDTTVLFKLWMDVLSGKLNTEEARRTLVDQTNYFEYPPTRAEV